MAMVAQIELVVKSIKYRQHVLYIKLICPVEHTSRAAYSFVIKLFEAIYIVARRGSLKVSSPSRIRIWDRR